MIVRGNTVGTTVPRADYAQTDEMKSDFILNKPAAALQKAQDTADSAKKTAEAALPKSGGTMTGPVDMGGKAIRNLASPETGTDAANRTFVEDYVNSKRKVFTLNLPAGSWTGEGPFTQTATLEGILASDMPHYGVVYAAEQQTRLQQKEAFALVDQLETADGSVCVTCFEEKPEADLTLQLEVNR